MSRYVILGGGVAGRRAAEVVRKRSAEAEIVIVDEQEEAFYYRPMLGEFLAGKLEPEQIRAKGADRLSGAGIRVLAGARAASVDLGARQVSLDSGERLSFDKLLIASGLRTERIPGDREGSRGVVYLDTLPDAREAIRRLGSVRRAVVYGASLQAVAALRGLRARGIDCVLVLSQERFWEGVLDPTASRILEERLEQEGVALIRGVRVEDLVWEGEDLKAVVPSKGEKLPADLLVVAAPQVPRLDYLEGSGLAAGPGGLVVDEGLRAGHENVFAAGDVAVVPAVHTGEVLPQPGWLSAWRQGSLAGLNMTGKGAVYQGFPALRAKVFDLDVVCLGLSDASGGDIREESGDYPYDELPYIYKKIVFKGGRVVGALFMGDATEAGAVEGWIRKGLVRERCDKQVWDQMFLARVQAAGASAALCPVCKFRMQVEDGYEEGSVMGCPACGAEFRLHRMPNGVFRAELAG